MEAVIVCSAGARPSSVTAAAGSVQSRPVAKTRAEEARRVEDAMKRGVGVAISASPASAVDLLLVDPLKRRLGRDPLTGKSFEEIVYGGRSPELGLDNDETGEPAPMRSLSEEVGVAPVLELGRYELRITGLEAGDYAAEFSVSEIAAPPGRRWKVVTRVEKVPTSHDMVHRYAIDVEPEPELRDDFVSGAFAGTGDGPQAAERLLTFATPTAASSVVEQGTALIVVAFYGAAARAQTFRASLNEKDVSSLFHPRAGGHDVVRLPAVVGDNVLRLRLEGGPPGAALQDDDALTFQVR